MAILGAAYANGRACAGDDSTADMFNDEKANLAMHYAAVTGKRADPEQYFSCSC